MLFSKLMSTVRRLLRWATVIGVVTVVAAPAHANFHLWGIQEVYSNSSGTLQFIELVDQFGGQNDIGFGAQFSPLQVTNSSATQTNTANIPPGDVTPGNSLNHMLLFGTSGIHAAGGPTPDYIIPNNFLFTSGGSISFFGYNGGAYTALPTDGLLSRTWNGGNALNSPTNQGRSSWRSRPASAACIFGAGDGPGRAPLHREIPGRLTPGIA
jgi:hypothetical protein